MERHSPGPWYPLYALAVLLLINVSNYADRQALHSLEKPVIDEFALSAREFGTLATAFVVAYSLCALPLGYLSDRWLRKNVIACGVVVWSMATTACAFCQTYNQLFVARALTGVGEAACVPSALAMISDYFPRKHRAKAVAAFAGAMLVGGGLGYMLGAVFAAGGSGVAGPIPEWRKTFLVLGPPGFVLAWLAFRLVEPQRGVTEEFLPLAHGRISTRDLATVLCIPSFIVFTISSIFFYFALGALQVFGPRFFRIYRGMDIRVAAALLGVAGIPAAALGLPSAGALADWLSQRYKSGPLLTVILGTALATPCVFALLVGAPNYLCAPLAFLAIYFFCFTAVPAAVVVHSVVEPEARATAMGVFTLATHLLGDALGPRVVGGIADALSSLKTALLFVPASLFVSAVLAVLALPAMGRDVDAMALRMKLRRERELTQRGGTNAHAQG